ncbi:hypothetical protein CAEBREN_03728 [Caenorhabditis brenneri]|uniref:Uncharacterized protein n=1 Tax=Caenorhabditis brenneri TaxID=135651 RepID=G0MCM3_CAEBE|nr:hypothetical protein CAEBREN_03728 [Caenorhabditis brenneri]
MKELVIKGRGPNGFKRGAFMDKYDVRTHSRGLYRKSKTLLVARVPRNRSRSTSADSHSTKISSCSRSPSSTRRNRNHKRHDSRGSRSPSPDGASIPSKSIVSAPPQGILHLLHLAALQSSQFANTQLVPFNSLEDEKKRTEQMLIELEKGNQVKLAIQLELQRREFEEAKKKLEKINRRD